MLITETDPGQHNRNLPQATSRIIEGGSWKKQRTIMLVPSDSMLSAKCAFAMWNLMTPPNQGMHRILILGEEVGQAYSNAIEQILQTPEIKDWEYILTVEADNAPPPDGLVKLIRRMDANPHLSAIGGLYWTKGTQGVPQIWGDPRDPVLNFRPIPPVPGQIVECCGVAMGFTLWRLSMFKDEKLRRPWFKTICSKEEGVGTQDLYAWADLRKHGYRAAVDCDVLVGHHDVSGAYGWKDIMW